MRTPTALRRVSFLAILLAAWASLASFGPWPKALCPAPWDVAATFWRLLWSGALIQATGRSLGRLGLGYLVSCVVGIPLGLAMAKNRFVHESVEPLVLGFQALPSICWLPLALLWFGLSDAAILFVVVMGSLLAIAIATANAVRELPPRLSLVASSLGIRGARYWLGVLLPGALPGILTGLELGWSFAWRALMAGELLFVAGGLGQLLANGRELLDTSQVMAVMVAIVLIGVGIDRVLFRALQRKVRIRWGLLARA